MGEFSRNASVVGVSVPFGGIAERLMWGLSTGAPSGEAMVVDLTCRSGGAVGLQERTVASLTAGGKSAGEQGENRFIMDCWVSWIGGEKTVIGVNALLVAGRKASSQRRVHS
jgi:hypothetical protein